MNKKEDFPHIVMLAPFFPPFMGAVSSRLESFARYWAQYARVTVINTEAFKEDKPYGRMVFPLTRWRFDFLKIAYYFPKLFRLVKEMSPDILFASIPPVWPLFETYLLSKRLGLPLIVDVRDLPASTYPTNTGLSFRWGFNVMGQAVSRYLLGRTKRAITVTECVLDQLKEFVRTEEFKGTVIQNGSEIEQFRNTRVNGKKYDIVYSGTLISVRDPKSMIKYLSYLREFYPQLSVLFLSDINCTNLGKRFILDLKKTSLDRNVEIENMTSKGRVFDYLCRAKLGLDSLAPGVLSHKGVASSKDYEYLAAGLPVVGLLDPDFYVETRRLISDNAVGILDPDPSSLARKTAELLKNPLRLKEMSDKARKVGERFDRKLLAEKYYRKVILPAWKKFSAE